MCILAVTPILQQDIGIPTVGDNWLLYAKDKIKENPFLKHQKLP